MTLSELLKPELILTGIECESKNDLISILVGKIYEYGYELPINENSLIKTIQIREEVGGTLLPSGLSIPHARLKDYEDFIITMAIPKGKLYHEGQELKLMSLMVSSQSGVPHYLKVLASLTKISRDNAYFTKLCNADSPENFLEIIKEKDQEL